MGLDCYVRRRIEGPSIYYPEENNGEYHYKELWYSRKFWELHHYFGNKLASGEDNNCEYIPIEEEDIQNLTNMLVINGALNHELDEYRQQELSDLIELLKSQESLDDLYYWGWY